MQNAPSVGAAITLRTERVWACVPTRTSDHPACGEKVKPGVAVCRRCTAILDQEKPQGTTWDCMRPPETRRERGRMAETKIRDEPRRVQSIAQTALKISSDRAEKAKKADP
jgi:hypothetical protein